MPDPNTGRLLILEGGGIRGLTTLQFLIRFEELYGAPVRDIFDLFVGTSVGTISALGLAFGKTTAELKTFFLEQGPWIFSTSTTTPGVRCGTLEKAAKLLINVPFYPNVNLSNVLEEEFGDAVMSDLTKPAAGMTVNFTNKSIVILSSFENPFTIGQDFSLKDAAMASSAAQLYFAQVGPIDGSYYEDGGIWANNPVNQGMALLRRLRSIKRMCVLGGGTGRGAFGFDDVPPEEPPSDHALARLMAIIGETISGPAEGNDLALQINSGFNMFPVNYYRYQFRIASPWTVEPDITDPAFLQYLQDVADDYVDDNITEINDFIAKLKA